MPVSGGHVQVAAARAAYAVVVCKSDICATYCFASQQYNGQRTRVPSWEDELRRARFMDRVKYVKHAVCWATQQLHGIRCEGKHGQSHQSTSEENQREDHTGGYFASHRNVVAERNQISNLQFNIMDACGRQSIGCQ